MSLFIYLQKLLKLHIHCDIVTSASLPPPQYTYSKIFNCTQFIIAKTSFSMITYKSQNNINRIDEYGYFKHCKVLFKTIVTCAVSGNLTLWGPNKMTDICTQGLQMDFLDRKDIVRKMLSVLFRGPSIYNGLILIPAWISNYIAYNA